MDRMILAHNSTKRNRDSSQGRRDEYVNRINSTPLPINSPSEPKVLVSAKSKGPNAGGNVAYTVDPDDQFMNADDGPHIPSALDNLGQNGRIHITSDVIRGGDGRFLRSYTDGSHSSSSIYRKVSAPGPT
jgi:hypothetical protein